MRIAAFLFLMMGTGSCFGGMIGTVTFSRTGAWGSTSGGEFTLEGTFNDASGNVLSSFSGMHSFCLEKSEQITLGTTFQFAISDNAVAGGGGAVGGFDPLDDKSKIIFDDWLNNRPLSNGNGYANNVQKAIWEIEGEGNWGGGAQTLIDNATGTAPDDIFVMNVFKFSDTAARWSDLNAFADANDGQLAGTLAGNNVLKQDQIVRIDSPPGSPEVPEPASALLFGLGACLFGTLRTRRRS